MATEQDYLGSEEWVKKMREQFKVLDRNKNGFLSQDDWAMWADKVTKVLKMDEEKEKKLREVHIKFASLLGAKPGVQVSEDEYLKAVAKFAANQGESKAFLAEVNQAMFDAFDTNQDGTIGLEEYTKLMECYNRGPEVAKAVFDSIDANHNGRIEVKELVAAAEKFWFAYESPIKS